MSEHIEGSSSIGQPAANGAPKKRLLLNAFDMNGIGHIR